MSVPDPLRYEFGRNWASYAHGHLDADRLRIAGEHLLGFLKLPDLAGRTFLDIGCGSGIHSLAALHAGAKRVVSFDYDEDSVRTTRSLHEAAGAPAHWTVLQGSVLDRGFLSRLEPADVVYSWGVLHHTGRMWEAVENAAATVATDGVFYFALYTSDVVRDPAAALRLKQRYNAAGPGLRRLLEWRHAWRVAIRHDLRRLRAPWSTMRGYRASRGMEFWTDIRDWLGGWPMEFAGIAETKALCRDRLGLELLALSAGAANTEYLVRPAGSRNYWDGVLAAHPAAKLERPFRPLRGRAWRADAAADPSAMLYEDRVPLGFARTSIEHVVERGAGRFSAGPEGVVFSTLDGSDPNANGKRYELRRGMA